MSELNFRQYQQAALKTESPVTPEMMQRFQTVHEILGEALAGLQMLIANYYFDQLKKYIFYGKAMSFPVELGDIKVPDKESREYQQAIKGIRYMHGVLGKITELEELLSTNYTADGPDTVNVMEEVGDDLWYSAILLDAVGVDFQMAAERNIAKLKARYPEKFSEVSAINRDLDTERQVLEGVPVVNGLPDEPPDKAT